MTSTLELPLLTPTLSRFAMRRRRRLGLTSQAVTLAPRHASWIVLPPGAAHASRIFSPRFTSISSIASCVPGSCTMNSPSAKPFTLSTHSPRSSFVKLRSDLAIQVSAGSLCHLQSFSAFSLPKRSIQRFTSAVGKLSRSSRRAPSMKSTPSSRFRMRLRSTPLTTFAIFLFGDAFAASTVALTAAKSGTSFM